jgi:Sec-independent protein secretion pathway component TatC
MLALYGLGILIAIVFGKKKNGKEKKKKKESSDEDLAG